MKNSLRALIALFAVLGLLLGACSTDESSSDDAVVSASGDQADDGSSSGDDSSSDAGNADDLIEGSKQADDLLGGQGCFEAFTLWGSIYAKAAQLGSPDTDPSELDALQEDIDKLKAEVPDEIADDVDTYAQAITEYSTAMREIVGDGSGNIDPSKIDDLAAASEILTDPAVQEAGDNVQNYLQENCSGIG